MSAQDNGGPAFPQTPLVADERDSGYGGPAWEHGMTLRDYFAAKAMQGIVSALSSGIRPADINLLARDAYGIADNMLKERNK